MKLSLTLEATPRLRTCPSLSAADATPAAARPRPMTVVPASPHRIDRRTARFNLTTPSPGVTASRRERFGDHMLDRLANVANAADRSFSTTKRTERNDHPAPKTGGTRHADRPKSLSSPPMGGDLGLLMAACSERLVRAFLATLTEAGYDHLTSTQAITVLLVGDGGNTVTQIADRLGVPTQAVSKICGVLYAEGLVDREPHSDDGRSRRLALTPEGGRVRDLM